MAASREVRRIEPDGTAWIQGDEEGTEIPVRLVVGRGGVLGVKRIAEEDALGIDQIGPAPPLPPQLSRSTVDSGHFDTSGIDQM